MGKKEISKKDLTAMLVHDLRSPLGIINWNLETLQEGLEDSLNKQQKKLLSSAINNSKELLEMIDSILDIERLEAGSIAVDFSAIDLPSLIRDRIEQMDILSQQMGLEFVLNCSADLPLVKADLNLLRRILFNLLFNASKYSPVGKPIEISLELSDKNVIVAIRDYGPGVPKEYRKSIFDKFVQVDAKDQGEVKSKGLGLTFCKLAVETQNGKIWVDEAEGGGSIFKFILPIY